MYGTLFKFILIVFLDQGSSSRWIIHRPQSESSLLQLKTVFLEGFATFLIPLVSNYINLQQECPLVYLYSCQNKWGIQVDAVFHVVLG